MLFIAVHKRRPGWLISRLFREPKILLMFFRDGIALLPGSRDRTGRAIIIFPPKEHQLNPDKIILGIFFVACTVSQITTLRSFVSL
ncbi:hypothetical protein COOONC_12783 [Cooperia oncophora]